MGRSWAVEVGSGVADPAGVRKARNMQLLLIAGAVLLAVAVGVRLWGRVMAGVQRRGPGDAGNISRPRLIVGWVLVAVGGLAFALLPLVWIAAPTSPDTSSTTIGQCCSPPRGR